MNSTGITSTVPPQDKVIPLSLVVLSVFSQEECEKIITAGQILPIEAGATLHGDKLDTEDDIRENKVAFFYPATENQWIFDRIIELFAQINRDAWRYEIVGVEPLQFSIYNSSEHYGWHMDLGDRGRSSLRKLTVTIQLSSPEDYQGGEFELLYGLPEVTPPRDHGSALLFPSYRIHRVLPVSGGTRCSLVAWAVGESRFR